MRGALIENAAKPDVRAVQPKVRLVAYTAEPMGIAVASARTCYAKDFVFVGQLLPSGERARTTLLEALPEHEKALDEIGYWKTAAERRAELVEAIEAVIEDESTVAALRLFADKAAGRAVGDERIAESIYEAGHHTPFQHPTFVFSLDDVSRNVVESFFHQHTFYNSEQQSQRYVEMANADVVVPPGIAADPARRAVFDHAVSQAWAAYHDLRARLVEANRKTMTAIGRIKGQSDADITKEAEKKAQEMARYVVPVAAATRLYHTISGIVLLRYARMAQATDAHAEAREVVDQMLAAVQEIDADFGTIEEEPHRFEDLPEWQLAGPARVPTGDDSLLVRHTEGAPAIVAEAIRDVTGSDLPDDELLNRVLDPEANRLWNDTLNTWDHSPVLRSLRHVHYTFRKRVSLTAYAQDQRHRMTPATRPMLHRLTGDEPNVYTPDVIAGDEEALAVYDEAIQALWTAMHELRSLGAPPEECAYLLPNATIQEYLQSGDLLSWIHKWRLRLCFNAQKEIFDASLAELRQVQAVHPELTRFLGPPCTFVAAAQPAELQDSVEACCPEGPRWCGVKVWKGFDAGAGKPKRPF